MSFLTRFKKNSSESDAPLGAPKKRRWLRIAVFFLVLAGIAAGAFFLKAGSILNKMSVGKDGIFRGLVKSLPGAKDELAGEKEGKINILLLGMRGEKVVGGGLLADTIMVISIHPKNGEGDTARASMVSIPRDLYVKVPGREEHRKINAVYALGEERDHGKGGMEDMRTVVGEVTGMDIPYAVAINFQGFIDLVNALGGVTVNLNEPFQEAIQFRGLEQRCDGIYYTIPSGGVEEKRIQRKNGTYYLNPKRYPLCFAKATPDNLECGGTFKLPAGVNELDGEKALCFTRARYQTNDFERARRQQQVIQAIKEKALSVGTLTDFGKINGVLDSLGDNVRTDFAVWEMKRFFELYQQNQNPTLSTKVLENSEEGLLYAPTETKETGYILLPLGENYDRIRALFQSLP
ncbi:MAG: LCP family protein [Candidatus Moraniibacteriota bacterium]